MWITRSHPVNRSTSAGALSKSCRNPVTTAGMINASSRIPVTNTSASINPVATPRFHPLFTNHCTAGSRANDRNSAIKMIVRKLESSCASHRIAKTVSAAPTSTTNSRRPPSLRTSGSQGSRGDSESGRASLTGGGYPASGGNTRTRPRCLAGDGFGHLLEVLDVPLGVGVAHHDRSRPALPLRTGALEHAPVELPEPGELWDPVVDLPQVAVLVDRRL